MVRARKRFGQHFLTDQGVLQRLVNQMALRSDDRLLEIGPGQGALTEPLAAQVNALQAIEIDRDLVPFLRARFSNLEVINEDVLRVDFAAVIARQPTRIVGNLPYNISSPLLLKLATFNREHPGLVRDGHFMLQREMANRMAAQPGSKAWGRLSVMLQISFDVEHLFDVAPESFDPPPKVWSSIVRLLPLAEPLVRDAEELAELDRVLRTAFAVRRKRLGNALKSLGLDWQSLGIDDGLRADDISSEQYLAIAKWLLDQR